MVGKTSMLYSQSGKMRTLYANRRTTTTDCHANGARANGHFLVRACEPKIRESIYKTTVTSSLHVNIFYYILFGHGVTQKDKKCQEYNVKQDFCDEIGNIKKMPDS